MTLDEFNQAVERGSVIVETSDDEPASPAQALPSTPIEQFIPLLTQLESVQRCLTSAPTFIPQSFQEQIQFVFTGGNYYLYLYFNNQWNQFSITGGSGVIQLLAGTGISLSPGGGTGTVTISVNLTAGSGISVSGATITNAGVTSIVAGSGISVSGPTGAVTISAAGGASFATSTGTIPDIPVGSLIMTTTPQNNDTVVTHGLGTTPKLIVITINNFQVPGNASGTQVYDFVNMYITFDNSGNPAAGFTLYSVTGNSQLVVGGLTTAWTKSAITNSGTMNLSLVSINSTTFTFRVTYYCSSGTLNVNQQVNGIAYLCMG